MREKKKRGSSPFMKIKEIEKQEQADTINAIDSLEVNQSTQEGFSF